MTDHPFQSPDLGPHYTDPRDNYLDGATIPVPKGSKLPARITVTEQVAFQSEDGQPTATPTGFSFTLTSDEQPFSRTTKVGQDWQPVDLGWLKDHPTSLLVVKNGDPKFWSGKPTPEQVAEAVAKVIEVGVQPPDPPKDLTRTAHSPPLPPPAQLVLVAVLLPGEDCRFRPADPSQVKVRCASGIARLTTTVYPG